jgi:tRNA-specific 2-thiouridylase
MARVVVGLSGGVDSSVAALLLKEQGHEVIGMFMRNWHDDTVTLKNECPWIEDSNDALQIAQHLNIPFQTIDLSETYHQRIVEYMFAEYQNGRTPNPDILCNREIKFDVFLQAALSIGAEYVATGHYCQKEVDSNGIHHLIKGRDNNKDQSYFLCQISQEQLQKALFPIGHLEKSEVRAIAQKNGLSTAQKKDSQGLCFIGKVSLPDFLQQKLKTKLGDVVLVQDKLLEFQLHPYNFNAIDDENLLQHLCKKIDYSELKGEIIGTHQGAHYYTIGQRKGLKIGGFKEPLFILSTNTISNTIFVGLGDNHQGLNRPALYIKKENMHWIIPKMQFIARKLELKARIRYRQPLENVCIYEYEQGYYVVFENLQRGITPGQFAAFYNDTELVCSGVIE